MKGDGDGPRAGPGGSGVRVNGGATMGRPAVVALLAYGGGIAVGFLSEIPPILLFFTGSAGLMLWLLLRRMSGRAGSALILLTLALAGLLRQELTSDYFSPLHISRFAGLWHEVRVVGTAVRDPTVRSGRREVVVETLSIGVGDASVRTSGSLLLRASGEWLDVAYGDVLAVEGILEAPSPARNPGGFDYRGYLAVRGVHGVMRVAGGEKLALIARGRGTALLGRLIYPARRLVSSALDQGLRGDPRAVIGALLLGERERLPAAVESWFAASGMIHVLAVSGLHIGILALVLTFLLRAAGVPRTPAAIAASILLVGYAFMTGLRPSVVRAVALFGMGSIALSLDRRVDHVNLLAAVALGLLVISPSALRDLGFQLSFLATFSILVLSPRLLAPLPSNLRSGSSPHARICQALGVSVAAQLGTAPLVIYHFFRLPLLAPLANLLVIPLVALALALSFPAVISTLAWPPLGEPFAAALWAVLSLLLAAVRWVAGIEWASVRVPSPSGGGVMLFYLTLLIVGGKAMGPRARRLALIWVLALANVWVWSRVYVPHAGEMNAVFLDVGQGDAAVVRTPCGRLIVVDGGPAFPEWSAGEEIVAPYLWREGRRQIDLLVLSHPDADHLGGLLFLVQEFDVGLVVDAGMERETRFYREFREIIERRGIPYRQVRAGDRIDGLGVPVRVLHPPRSWGAEGGDAPSPSANEWSVVLALEWGDWMLLLTGDLERCGPIARTARGRQRKIVLKVPHHGSAGANGEAFVAALRPEIAVISVGARNRFGLPDPAVIERYERCGSSVWRTDRAGAVVVRIDGAGVRAEGMVRPGARPHREIGDAWSWTARR